MKNLERIKVSIQAATVSNDDKVVMTDLFSQVSDEYLEEIADLFEKKPEWIVIFNENRKKKIEAYQSGNQALWAEILEQEKKYVEDLTYGLD